MNSKIKLYTILIALLSFYNSLNTQIFTNLDAIQEYAEKFDEFPDADNITQLIDWLDPSYKSFHLKHYPGLISRLFARLGLKKPVWSIEGFKKLLDKTAHQRAIKGYKGKFIQKINPSYKDNFFIWGNLHGAFHSLLRDLQELKKRKVIDNSLKICNENDYFIFIGNVIDHSPFVLETLTLILRIMQVNPDKVFYVRGHHEDHKEWLKYSLRDELEVRAAHLSDKEIPLQSIITKFFNTLPLALYLTSNESSTTNETSTIDLLRISSFGLNERELDEKSYGNFFSLVDRNIHYIEPSSNQKIKPLPKNNAVLDALITTKHWSLYAEREKYWTSESYPYGGLQFLGLDDKIVKWAILSSPTNTYRRLFNFQYDSFVQLSIKNGINLWQLKVYNRDIRSKNLLYKTKNISLTSPKEYLEEKREKTKPKRIELEKLSLGTTMDLSGAYKQYSKHYKDGMFLAINEINQRGGIGGYFLDLVVLDDGYNASRARSNIQSLLDQNIDIILGSMGAPVLKSYLDLIKEKKVISLFPFTGEMFARQSNLDYIINFIPPYIAEGSLLGTYALDSLKTKNIVFYYNPSIEGTIKAAKKKLKPVGTQIKKIPYIKDDNPNKNEAIKNVVQEIIKINPDTILFTCPPKAARELIERLGLSIIKEKYLLGMSDLSDIDFINYIQARGLSFIYTFFLPDPNDASILIAKEFRERAQAKGLPINSEIFFGYILIKLFSHIIEKVNGPITKETIIKTVEQIKNINFGGLPLNFDPQLRQLSHTLWLVIGKEREKYKIKFENGNITTKKI